MEAEISVRYFLRRALLFLVRSVRVRNVGGAEDGGVLGLMEVADGWEFHDVVLLLVFFGRGFGHWDGLVMMGGH